MVPFAISTRMAWTRQTWADHLPMNVVKELMGHASISTTAEFYSTVSDDHRARAQWIVEALTVGRRSENDARVMPEVAPRQIRQASRGLVAETTPFRVGVYEK